MYVVLVNRALIHSVGLGDIGSDLSTQEAETEEP